MCTFTLIMVPRTNQLIHSYQSTNEKLLHVQQMNTGWWGGGGGSYLKIHARATWEAVCVIIIMHIISLIMVGIHETTESPPPQKKTPHKTETNRELLAQFHRLHTEPCTWLKRWKQQNIWHVQKLLSADFDQTWLALLDINAPWTPSITVRENRTLVTTTPVMYICFCIPSPFYNFKSSQLLETLRFRVLQF